MKANKHPELHEITVMCACGNAIKTSSTNAGLKVTICSSCHPYFTGSQKVLDTAGRIEKFNKKFKKGAQQ